MITRIEAVILKRIGMDKVAKERQKLKDQVCEKYLEACLGAIDKLIQGTARRGDDKVVYFPPELGKGQELLLEAIKEHIERVGFVTTRTTGCCGIIIDIV